MNKLINKLITGTIVKCKKISIKVDETGLQSIMLETHPTINVATLIHGIFLNFTKNEKVLLNCGIASLLNKARLPLSETMIEIKNKHVLIIPLEKDLDLMSADKVKINAGLNGGISKEFKLELT